MSLFDKLLDTARRYAQQNPDKVRGITDRAARLADQQTKGKYRSQIDAAVHKVDGMTGGGMTGGSPRPRPEDLQGPHHDGPHHDGPHHDGAHHDGPHHDGPPAR